MITTFVVFAILVFAWNCWLTYWLLKAITEFGKIAKAADRMTREMRAMAEEDSAFFGGRGG